MSKDSSNLHSALPIPSNQRTGWWIAPISLAATVVIFFSAQIIGLFSISLFPILNHWSKTRADDWLTNSVAAQFAYGLVADGMIILGIALMLQLFHWQWSTIGLKVPKWQHIVIGVVAAVPYYVIYIIVVTILNALVPAFNINQKQQIGFNSVHGLVPLILTFVSLVVVPPLAEEIAMRGFLYSGLRKWLPKVVAALIVSVLFSSAHLLEGGASGPLWIGAIDTFILSLVLVALREKTGNLWAGITLHAVKNSVAFVSLFIISGR